VSYDAEAQIRGLWIREARMDAESRLRQKRAEDNCMWLRCKIADHGWQWIIAHTAYEQLSPAASGVREHLALYAMIADEYRDHG
jgi:hypothetical protein